MTKSKKKIAEEKKEVRFRRKLLEEMLRLSTSGFGLVAALSWNELIKTAIAQYVEPFVGKDSGIISLLIYAVIVTVLAVTVTYSLTRLKDRI
jgi:uncharacterized membrane protein (DUF106 family)